MAPPSHKGSVHGILRHSMHDAESSKMNDDSKMCAGISELRQLYCNTRHPTHTSHAEPMQALLIALSCRGAHYRELKPFVRIWKGLRNIAQQYLLCISDVVRTGKVDY
jgi:hypothetical protein